MISYQVAKDEAEKNAAISLVHAIYVQEGYISPEQELRLDTHLLHHHTSTTIICLSKEIVVGTISIIVDGGNNLPMETIYAFELTEIRKSRNKIAEVSQFAVADKDKEANLDIMLGLLSHTIHLAIDRDIDCLCFSINPKHQLFYRALGCTQIGPERPYPFVNNAPALGFMLDLKNITSPLQPITSSSILQRVLSQTPQKEFFL